MHHLRNATLLARLVLVWFALSMGVAIASPMVKPQAMQLICSSAGAVKVLAASDDGKLPAQSHTLDCPLCASIGAPPPIGLVVFSAAVPLAFVVPKKHAQAHFFVLTAPPPARAPPQFS